MHPSPFPEPNKSKLTIINCCVNKNQDFLFIIKNISIYLLDSKKLYAEAMQCGYVERKVIKCLIVGAAGVGKTSIKHLILNKELPKQRESTGVMENPVLAVSLSRSVAIACANLKEDNSWHVIHNDEELIKMIAVHINAGQVRKRNISENSQEKFKNIDTTINDLENIVENSAETESPAEIISNKWISAIMETKRGMSYFERVWCHL